MEKIILAHYINVGNMSPQKVAETMDDIRKAITPHDDQLVHFLYPVRDQETRIECINPKLVSEEDYQQARRVLEKNQAIVTRLLSEKMGI
jgi:hypothetical protein